MRVLLLVLVVLTWTPAVASAQANLCDPNWLERANGSEVRALLRGGADVNQICNDNSNRPLHQAILTDGVSPGVFRALVEAGADILAANIDGSSPLDYAEDRFARAERNFQPGSGAYRREESIYLAVNRGFEADRHGAAEEAHSKLCDLEWWRSSASGPAVEALLRTPGVDPNTVCNLSNDRPIHLPLKLTSFVMLREGIVSGIEALMDANADPHIRNSSRESAVDLAGMREDRYRDRIVQQQMRWCRNEIDGQELENEIARNEHNIDAFLVVGSRATGETFEEMDKRLILEL